MGALTILIEGERQDSEYFEKGLVDAAWILAGYVWQSLGKMRERVDDLEDYAESKWAGRDGHM